MATKDNLVAPPEVFTGAMFDESNPQSLVNLLPDRLVPILHRVRAKLPKTLFSPESTVRMTVKPDERDERIRLSFWDEYNNATAMNRKMGIQRLLDNVVSWEGWTTYYEPDDIKMLWIFTPPRSYAQSMKYILHLGTERLLEIMSLPIIDNRGTVDSKVVTQILKAFQLVDTRVKGAIVQRMQIDQRNLNLSATVDPKESMIDFSGMAIEDLEKLERKISSSKSIEAKLLSRAETEEQKEAILTVKAELDKVTLRMPALPGDEELERVDNG